jgi:uncharacterized protein YsxB (DUF464 family)
LITFHGILSADSKKTELLFLEVSGHFKADKQGLSVPCAAMSALIRTYGRQIESCKGLTVKIKADKAGSFRAEIESIDPDEKGWYAGICDFLLCGLGDLVRDYPHEFVMELKRRRKHGS